MLPRTKRVLAQIKVFVVTIALMCLCFSLGFGPDYLAYRRTQEPLHIHQAIVTDTLKINWVLDDLIVNTGPRTTNLFVSNNQLYVYGSQSSGQPFLWQVNQADGQFLKNITPSRYVLPSSFTGIDSIAFDSTYIYIAYTGGKTIKGSTMGAGGFAIYDTIRQEVVWSRRVPSVNTVESFVAGHGIIVVDNGFGEYYIADLNTRSLSSPIEKEDFYIVFEQGGILYNKVTSLWYTQINKDYALQDMDWWLPILDNVALPPIILGRDMLIRTRTGNMVGEVKVVNRENGRIMLTSPIPSISNIAVQGGFAYYLALPNQLIRWDLASGEIQQLVEFSGGNFRLEDERGYFVAVDDQNLFAYLGDGRQLFAFQFAQPMASNK